MLESMAENRVTHALCIGVQFTQDETGGSARSTIEKILAETLASNRPTHTM